jgi:hypothetical protein
MGFRHDLLAARRGDDDPSFTIRARQSGVENPSCEETGRMDRAMIDEPKSQLFDPLACALAIPPSQEPADVPIRHRGPLSRQPGIWMIPASLDGPCWTDTASAESSAQPMRSRT